MGTRSGGRDKENYGILESEDDSDFGTSDGAPSDYEALRDPVEMELGADIYEVLEYIVLDWPSQSIALLNEADGRKEEPSLLGSAHLVAGTCPPSGGGKAAKDVDFAPQLVKIDLTGTQGLQDMNRVEFTKKSVKEGANRIMTIGEGVYVMSDKRLAVYTPQLKRREKMDGEFGYAMARHGDSIVYGLDESLESATLSLEKRERFNFGGKIESICPVDRSTIAVSGKEVYLLDMRSGDKQLVFSNGQVDVNSVGGNGESILVSGDDKGILKLTDLRAPDEQLEVIKFHKSPVTHVAFADRETFGSSSDCEVCLWDTSFVEEWDYHKYLSFVHQGQRFYKDFQFVGEGALATTSEGGICIFKPRAPLDASN